MIKDIDNKEESKIGLSQNFPTDKKFECQRLRKNCRCLLCTVPYRHNPTGLQEEGINCQGLPDTNVVFNDNGVDHNPTNKKTKKFLKIGKMAVKTLKSVRKSIPKLQKDLVNESKIWYILSKIANFTFFTTKCSKQVKLKVPKFKLLQNGWVNGFAKTPKWLNLCIQKA